MLRALGNLGFYHKPSKDQILLHSGAKCLVRRLSEEVNNNNTSGDSSIIKMLCLVLTNVSCEHLELATELMAEGVLPPVGRVIAENTSHPVIMAGISVLRMLVDCGKACQEKFLVAGIPDILVARLGEVGMQEVIDKLLEFLKEILESEELRELQLALVRAQIGHPLCLIGKWSPSKDAKYAALEMLGEEWNVCLYVLLMNCTIGMLATDDACMKLMFSDDVISASLFEFLDSRDPAVTCSGLYLAVNFARNEENCLSLMARGLQDRLVKVLTEGNEEPEGIKLVFVSWSILRNLGVSQKNKDELADKFIPEITRRYLCSANDSVVYKVLGAVRTILHKSESGCQLFLSSLGDLLPKITELESHGIEHVQSESCRLVGTLVKGSSGEREQLRQLWEAGGAKSLTFLLNSKHEVMKNEGVLALYILASGVPGLGEEMGQRGIDDALWDILSDQAAAEQCMPAEFLSNIMMLVAKIGMRDVTDEKLICFKKLGLRHADNKQIQTIISSVLK